jgi:hypothetical protein
MIARRCIWVLFGFLILLAACQRSQPGTYLTLSGRIFEFNYRLSIATYVVSYTIAAPIPKGSRAEASFEDPRGGPPLIVTQDIFPFWTKLILTSPPVHCIRAGKTYRVDVTLRGPDGTLLQALQTTITSTLDQSVLSEHSLVVGPAYHPNPQVFRGDGILDLYPETGCPAQS